MTRRTFIAFLTALLPANWPRSSDAPVPAGYRRVTAFAAHPTPPKHFVVLKPRRAGGSEAAREWMRHYGGNLRAFYTEPPIVTIYPSRGPGLCDLAYRKP